MEKVMGKFFKYLVKILYPEKIELYKLKIFFYIASSLFLSLSFDFEFVDDFNRGLYYGQWKSVKGKWRVKDGFLIQYQENSPNSNLYKKIYQKGNMYYEWKVKLESGYSVGLHIFSSDISYEERGDSYLIWQDNEGVKLYISTESGGLSDVFEQNLNLPSKPGDEYTFKIWYSPHDRRIIIVRDNYLAIDTKIPFPIKEGKYVSFRTRFSIVKIDYIKIRSFNEFPSNDQFKFTNIIVDKAKHNKIIQTEIIVRTDTLKNVNDAKEFIDMMVKAGIKRVSVGFKDDETGKFFIQVPDAPYIVVMPGYEDEIVINTLISEAHKNNIKVYAWVPTFRDPVLVKYRPDWVMMRKIGDKVIPNVNWVSPVRNEVQERMFKIWKSILTRFDVDGVRIDHIRFDEDWEDFSDFTRQIIMKKYGFDIMKIKPQTDNWIKWVDFRADVITDFLKKLIKMIREIKPDLDIGIYALPFSVQYGSYYEWTGTGQDFERLSKIQNMKIFVMAYWEDFCPNEGPDAVREWLDNIIGNSYKLGGDVIVPTYSVTDWASAWNKELSQSEWYMYDKICREVALKYNYNFISYFYYWKWDLDKMKKAGADE